jgi:glycerate kinase
VCPDKFRGSLNAPEAAAALAAGLRRAGLAEVREVPLADGGEGTLDALLLARGGRRRSVRVTGPLGKAVDAEYGELDDGTAVVEMARASGLALVSRNDPLEATTKGTGELIAAAVHRGARRVLVGVGGSATTDGGLGAVEALGWSLRGAEVVVACDVTTTFVDAAPRFGPQKGASEKQVELLTRRLERLSGLYEERTGVAVAGLLGSGAAGGLAGGLAALGARLAPGFEVVAGAARLDEALEGASLVVTGEGRVDAASLEGKVVGGALEWASRAGVGARAVVAGSIDTDAAALLPPGVLALSLVDRAFDADDAMARAALLVEEAGVEVGRWALRS